MLTASLQSTWEAQQRGRQKPKNSINYMEEIDSKTHSDGGGGGTRNNMLQISPPSLNRGNSGSNGNSAEITELPNLRIPQNRGLGNTATASLNTNTIVLQQQQQQQQQTSPRSSAAREVLGGSRKYRAQSRQSSNSQNRHNKRQQKEYHMSTSNAAGESFGSNSGSEGGLFPHIPNNAGNSNNNTQMQRRMMPSLHNPSNTNTMANGATSFGAPSPSVGHSNTHNTTSMQHKDLAIITEDIGSAGCTSIKGLKPGNPNWINQDGFFMLDNGNHNQDVKIYCVFDGHGENGHHVSRRCRENFPHFIKSTNYNMDQAFNMMQNDLSSSDIDVRCSGATCVLAMVTNHKIMVFNCGDSRAVLGKKTHNGSIMAHPMSNDHKPDKPEERKRILSCGGHLGCRQVLVNQGNRGPVSMPVGPCRVWYQHRGETLGLAMSRSLGDAIVHKFGVSAEPEPMEHSYDESCEFLLIATDGVWDVVDNNHAVQMMQNLAMRSPNWTPLEASGMICKFARSRWEKLSPMIDDITCIVIKLRR